MCNDVPLLLSLHVPLLGDERRDGGGGAQGSDGGTREIWERPDGRWVSRRVRAERWRSCEEGVEMRGGEERGRSRWIWRGGRRTLLGVQLSPASRGTTWGGRGAVGGRRKIMSILNQWVQYRLVIKQTLHWPLPARWWPRGSLWWICRNKWLCYYSSQYNDK